MVVIWPKTSSSQRESPIFRSSFYDKEYEEVNAYLDRVNNRDPSASSEVQPQFGMVDKKRDHKDTAEREKDQSLAKRSGKRKDSGISSANPDQVWSLILFCGTLGRVFFPKTSVAIVILFWLKWAGYLAMAGLNLLAQISDRISPYGV